MSLTYIVTGASRGIGLEFVSQIAAKGDTVFALTRNPSASEGLQKLVENKKVIAVQLDITDQKSIKDAVEEVSKNAPHGVDVLINNAAISGQRNRSILDTDRDEYALVLSTNFVAVTDITTAFLPLLRQRGQEKTKKILNMSSNIASISEVNSIIPDGAPAAYSVSKAALNMYTKLTANKLAKDNILVYASYPGWVKTDMGTDAAIVEKKDSVFGMLNVLGNLTPETSGSFFDYEGNELAW